MHPRVVFPAVLLASVTVLAIVAIFVWQPWESNGSGDASDQPRLTPEGVLALVSAEHAGCPEQPAVVLTAEVAYDGDGKWTVAYRDYRWEVDEDGESVRTLGDELPCPER